MAKEVVGVAQGRDGGEVKTMAEATETTAVKKWEEMSPRECDAWIAEHVCGWHSIDRHPFDGWGGMMPGQTHPAKHQIPAYTSDIARAYEMEEAIMAKGLAREYARRLAVTAAPERLLPVDVVFTYDAVFDIAHATPEQRAHAAYLALNRG